MLLLLIDSDDDVCIRVSINSIPLLNEAFFEHISPSHCYFIGCPYLPIIINETIPWSDKKVICDPIVYDIPSLSPGDYQTISFIIL